ncbi:autotransporter outer membrane beta-barrel domain-containing protein [uncultured Dialister sp.]|uniref:autotransporter outer membrane beta-barrel domain-containing protein n=1 Tax=uncultured Dialister sp. TaxID=278064 RepID=UPI0026705B53|nr:autotransporter outer membrane beta-barrel domain-containing protein [uncultured Dialister sp.]
MPVEAAERTTPLVVTEKDQTIHDDFGTASQPVSITDGKTPAILEIASTAAADDKGVTKVNSQTINGHFTQPSNVKTGEANGIWVQDKYPGKVNLADGLTVEVDATGNQYNATGIYLEGVDRSHDPKSTDESVNANEEYKNNGNQISSTTVNVGSGTTITVNAKAPEGKKGTIVNSVALENHFGHMNVGDNVSLNLTTGAFNENYSAGFYQLYYGNTSIGNGFTSTVTATTGNDSGPAIVSAVKSLHDRPDDHQIHAITQNKLHIGDDAVLTAQVHDQTQGDYTENGSIDETGAFLSRTDFIIGDRMKVDTEQTGVPGRKGDGINESTIITGIYTRAAKGSIGSDLTNTVKVKNRNMQMVAGMRFSGWLQNGDERPENPSDDTSIVSVGARNINKIDVEDSIARHLVGIIADSDSNINIGQECQIHMDINQSQVSGYTYGIYAGAGGSNSTIDFGSHGTFSLTQVGGTSNQTIGICTDPNSTIHFGSYGTVSLKQQDGGTSKNGMFGIYADANTKIDFGPHGTLSLMQDGGISNKTMGIYAVSDSKIDFGPYGTLSLAQDGGTSNQTMGIYAVSDSKIDFGPYGTVSLQFEGDYQGNSQILSDLWNYGADTEVKDHASFTVIGNLTKAVPLAITQIRGIYVGNGTGRFGDNLTVHTSGHNYAMVSGIVASADTETTNLSVGDNAHVTVDATEDETGTTNKLPDGNYIAGIKNSGKGSFVTVGRNAQIQVSAPEDKEVSALWVYKNAEMKMGDGAVLTVNSAAAEKNNVVKAELAGTVNFDGGMTLAGTQNAIYSTGDGSLVKAMGEGRKVILGDLESADKGSIKLNLNTADSLLRGKSTVNGGNTELTVANGALWNMTDTSQVTTLNHNNGGIVNMTYNPHLQRLDVGTYNGNGGIFRMKSDLNELETDGSLHADKVYIDKAMEGSTGFIQVHDQSFLTGHEVTGTKYQLLVTDESRKAKFSGLTLDEGGLWDVTPTIQNGAYVRDVMGVTNANEKQWYLTKLERKVNKDTIPLMKAAGNSYALYRLDIDSLRKRMGDLRFRNLKDTSGLWARDFHGAYEGRGVDSRYNGFQLGYDYAANDKSVYGFFAERNISNPKYSYGSSKDHGLSGGLYGTWLGDSGVYTDVVAKWGRDDTNLRTRGGWPDSANYRTWNESLSVEFGKTFTGDNGLFLEPEAQIVFGHLGSKDYTTRRGRTVSMGSYDSAIGRLGILLGKRVTNRENPYDYYLKFSVLHEFGGERNFHLAAPDGETYDYSEDYRDTWEEAGFGGTWHINGNTSLYADAERSFGGMWHKKWQWNVGVNWQF